MAHSKQALKRARQNLELRLKNRAARSTMKSAMKDVDDAVASGDKDAAKKALALGMKKVDKCAQRSVVHKNNASRKKSAMSAKVATLLSKP